MTADFRQTEADNPHLKSILERLTALGLIKDWVKNRVWTREEMMEYLDAADHPPELILQARARIEEGAAKRAKNSMRREDEPAWVEAMALDGVWRGQFSEAASEVAQSASELEPAP